MTITDQAAAGLLADIDAWCACTGSKPGELGTMVLNHAGFVPLLRKRGSLKTETAAKLRAFMGQFPTAAALPADLRRGLMQQGRTGVTWSPGNHRGTMIRLGHPELIDPPQVPPPPAMGGGQAAHLGCGNSCRQDRRPRPADVRQRADRHGPGVLA